MTDLPATRIVLKGPFAPPTAGVYGPHVRKTAHHIYQVWRDGRLVASGSCGPDFAEAQAHVLNVAATKGLIDAPVITLPPT